MQDPVLVLDCDDCMGINYSYSDTYIARNDSSGADACRAAKQGLRATWPGLQTSGTAPAGTPSAFPAGSGQWHCAASYEGDYGVCCSPCD
jgi:hypothetical protein